jgi:hypothetical protein
MNPRDPFKGCWDRFDRAIAHRDRAMRVWAEFLDNEDAYSVNLYMDREREGVGRGTLRVSPGDELPSMLPILFGEYFYNLRAALDYAVYATAVIDNNWQDPPPGESVLQYPICESPGSWSKNAFHVAPLSKKHQGWIEVVQPYAGGENPRLRGSYWLNHLARLDRHRELRVVGAYVAESNPIVSVKAPAIVTFDPLDEETFVDGDAVLASFTVSPWQDGDDVRANPQAELQLELKDFVLGRPAEAKWLFMPLRSRLLMIESVVDTEVGRLEYDCVRSTRSRFLDRDWDGFKRS